MLRPILLHPNPKLKKVCEPVVKIDDAVIKLSADMLDTMYHAPGIGLAAPQIGILSRIIVIDCEKEEAAKRKPIVMINPEIVASSDEENIYEEGCLSIPEQFAEVKRGPVLSKLNGWTKMEQSNCKSLMAYGPHVSSMRLII